MPIKLLITGGSGDLGRVLCRRAVDAGHQVVAAYLTRPERLTAGEPLQLDLTDRSAALEALNRVQPDAIIHTAIPAPSSPTLRHQILVSAFHLAAWCEKRVPLLLLSTDMIFDGTRPPYREDAPPSPRSVYGQAKAEMESVGDFVVRTSLIYDFEPGNKQIDWMVERIGRGEKLRLYTDEMRSAVWVRSLADALLELMESPYRGTFHVAGAAPVSRMALGWRLLEAVGIDPAPHIEPVSQTSSGRPADLTLDVTKVQTLLRTPMLTLDEAYAQWQAEKEAAQ